MRIAKACKQVWCLMQCLARLMYVQHPVTLCEELWMQKHSRPDRSGNVQCSGYGMPGAVVVLEFVDRLFSTSRQLSECQCWTIWRRLGKGQTTTGWLTGWIWKLADDHGLLVWIITEMTRLSCAGAYKLTTNKILYHRRMVGAQRVLSASRIMRPSSVNRMQMLRTEIFRVGMH